MMLFVVNRCLSDFYKNILSCFPILYRYGNIIESFSILIRVRGQALYGIIKCLFYRAQKYKKQKTSVRPVTATVAGAKTVVPVATEKRAV